MAPLTSALGEDPAGGVIFAAIPRRGPAGRDRPRQRRLVQPGLRRSAARPRGRSPRASDRGHRQRLNQDVWSAPESRLPRPVSTPPSTPRPTDPLANYDLIFNTGVYPGAANLTARARLGTFFAAGGGYIGAGMNGAGTALTGIPSPV